MKMGLKSESGFYWGGFYGEGPYGPFKGEPKFSSNEKSTPAFTLEDFVSTDEYAKENCRKLFGDDIKDTTCPVCDDPESTPRCQFSLESYYRYLIIDSKDWVEFIAEAVEKIGSIRFYPSKGKIKQGDLLQLNKDGTVSKAKRAA